MHLTPTDERDLVWEWATAEVNSARFGHLYDALSPRVREALNANARTAITAEEWANLVQVVSSARRPLLAGLVRLGTSWHASTMAPTELEQLRLVWFHDAVPSGRLSDLVNLLDTGADIPHEPTFAANFRALAAGFEEGRMRGRPILVAEHGAGPYAILEGYTRCAVLLSRYRRGLPVPEIAVIVGVCPRIREWRLHDHPAGRALWT